MPQPSSTTGASLSLLTMTSAHCQVSHHLRPIRKFRDWRGSGQFSTGVWRRSQVLCFRHLNRGIEFMRAKSTLTMAVALFALSIAIESHAAPAVLQRGYDTNVSGANLSETILNTSNIGPDTFGLLFNLPVDDKIFAQPLYVPNVVVPNLGTHNVL